MSLPLSSARLAATYACLREFPPFNRWRLPPPDDVEFRVVRDPRQQGHYNRYVRSDHHWLAVSSRTVGHFTTLAQVVAHEMIHLKQALTRSETANTQHNAEFHRLAARVCRTFGWDVRAFV